MKINYILNKYKKFKENSRSKKHILGLGMFHKHKTYRS